MKTVNIPVYGNSVGVWKYCAVCLNIAYILRRLAYMYSVSSPLRWHELSLCSRHLVSQSSWRHRHMYS